MKDLIDQRNFREKCARSIVKSYNVHYMTKEEQDAKKTAESKEEPLQAKTGSNEEAAFKADERYADVPSSQYGTTSVQDPVTKEQIEKILGERQNKLFETMNEFQ